jgi:hypothetical protein
MGHETEALLVSIVLSQQKKIRELSSTIGHRAAETKNN